jgi:hypothetical protein
VATEQADVFEDGKSADHSISFSSIGSRVKTGNASIRRCPVSSDTIQPVEPRLSPAPPSLTRRRESLDRRDSYVS